MPQATLPTAGKGTQLGYNTTSGAGPYTYTKLGQLVTLKPNFKSNETELKLLETDWLAYLSTTKEGEQDFTIYFVPGDVGVQQVITLWSASTVVHWEVKHPDGTSTILFDAWVRDLDGPNFENDEIITLDCTMRIMTKPVFGTAPVTP